MVTRAITAAKTAESESISMLAEPNGKGHASRRDCDRPEMSTPSDGSKTVPPPSTAPAAPIRHAAFRASADGQREEAPRQQNR